MKTIKHNYSGKSLNELYEQHDKGSGGFYSHWWENEKFADEHFDKGVYEINVEKKLTNITHEEQKNKLPKGWDFPHPAVLAEAILEHYKKTLELRVKSLENDINKIKKIINF